ncbi:MAG: hypothetical protein ACI81Q_001620, partial [Paracoccaceae bacterium]
MCIYHQKKRGTGTKYMRRLLMSASLVAGAAFAVTA